MPARLQLKLGAVTDQDRLPDSPDTIVVVEPRRSNQLVPAIQAALARAAELGQLESSRQHLTQALEGDRNINIAMGILMERHHLGKDASFEALRGRARSEGRKVGDLAQELITAAELLNGFAAPAAAKKSVNRTQ